MTRFRWIFLLLMPCIAVADELTGIWSAPGKDTVEGYHRVVIVDGASRIFFHYELNFAHRCDVFGIAHRLSGDRYVFKNDKEHHFYEGHESYGLEENQDCEVSFERDGQLLKVRSTGNCQSFCGMRASIGGDLLKVPDENLTVSPPSKEP